MSIRFYVAPQAGTGTFEAPYRSLLNSFIDVASGEFFQEIDNPARRLSICCVTASDTTHANIAADSRVIVISRLYADLAALKTGLNETLDNIPGAATIKTKLETVGISTSWITGTNTLKDAIRYLFRVHFMGQIADGEGNANVKTFIANNLDTTVQQVPAQVRNAVRNWMQAKGLAIGWIGNTTTVREVVHFIVTNLGLGIIKMAAEDF